MLNQGGQEARKPGHRENAHLLGFKFDAWEGGHRVPCIIRGPGKVPPGSQSKELWAIDTCWPQWQHWLTILCNPGRSRQL